MRMPGLVMEGALPSARATAAVGRPGSALLSGVVPQQGCTAAKFQECLGKAGACIPMCASGNIIGCLLCFARDAPDCLPCMFNRA
jgi:hypothetical protein